MQLQFFIVWFGKARLYFLLSVKPISFLKNQFNMKPDAKFVVVRPERPYQVSIRYITALKRTSYKIEIYERTNS